MSRSSQVLRPLLLFATLFGTTAGIFACTTVEADRIYARDLAREEPIFSALDPDLEIGYAPRPGITRVLGGGELSRLAQRYGIEHPASISSACFLRKVSEQTGAVPQSRDVERGETVSVEVRSGGAHLSFSAKAESAGRAGDSVLVRNPLNGRLFQARVESKGKVGIQK